MQEATRFFQPTIKDADGPWKSLPALWADLLVKKDFTVRFWPSFSPLHACNLVIWVSRFPFSLAWIFESEWESQSRSAKQPDRVCRVGALDHCVDLVKLVGVRWINDRLSTLCLWAFARRKLTFFKADPIEWIPVSTTRSLLSHTFHVLRRWYITFSSHCMHYFSRFLLVFRCFAGLKKKGPCLWEM